MDGFVCHRCNEEEDGAVSANDKYIKHGMEYPSLKTEINRRVWLG